MADFALCDDHWAELLFSLWPYTMISFFSVCTVSFKQMSHFIFFFFFAEHISLAGPVIFS